MNDPAYEGDFYAWTQAQVAALRAQDLAARDVGHLAAEIDSLGNEQAHAVESHLVLVLTHLLKWRYQPQRHRRGCQTSALLGRQRIARRLRRSPGLEPQVPTLLTDAYANARKRAAQGIGLPLATFPETCPWSLAQVRDADFLPEEAP
jgi:hypothetical protein